MDNLLESLLIANFIHFFIHILTPLIIIRVFKKLFLFYYILLIKFWKSNFGDTYCWKEWGKWGVGVAGEIGETGTSGVTGVIGRIDVAGGN